MEFGISCSISVRFRSFWKTLKSFSVVFYHVWFCFFFSSKLVGLIQSYLVRLIYFWSGSLSIFRFIVLNCGKKKIEFCLFWSDLFRSVSISFDQLWLLWLFLVVCDYFRSILVEFSRCRSILVVINRVWWCLRSSMFSHEKTHRVHGLEALTRKGNMRNWEKKLEEKKNRKQR